MNRLLVGTALATLLSVGPALAADTDATGPDQSTGAKQQSSEPSESGAAEDKAMNPSEGTSSDTSGGAKEQSSAPPDSSAADPSKPNPTMDTNKQEPSGAMAPQSGEQPASPSTPMETQQMETPSAPDSAAQKSAQFGTTVPADAVSISAYYNEDVYDTQENDIGDVKDILLDKDGRISTVIIGVGGFLGVGEKDVAVPFNALKVAEKAGDRYLVINATKEALEKAPGYTFDATKGVWVPAAKQG
jgi:sporulation protein YlmC with PRC-barrel domain